MKKQLKTVVLLACATIGLAGIGGTITYAGFVNNTTLYRDVGTDGSTKAVFLTAENVDLEANEALVFCRVWKGQGTGIWIQSIQRMGEYYVFRIPIAYSSSARYDSILFARINPAYKSNPTYSNPNDNNDKGIWNQTSDLTLNFDTSNYFRITGYSGSTLTGDWGSAYNPTA